MIVTPIMAPTRIAVFNELAADPRTDLLVTYLATTAPNRQWATLEEEIAFRHVVLKERWRRARSESYVHVSTGLIRTLRDWKPDVVLAGGWDQPIHIEAFALRRAFGYSFLWWVESTPRDRRTYRREVEWMKKRFVRTADGLVVPGSASQAYVESLGAPSDRIFVAPNAIDNDFFRTASIDRSNGSGPVRFLYVGRLEPTKGIVPLLDAWSRMGVESSLTLVGHGSLEGAIRSRIAADALPAIHVRGHLDREALLSEYRRADIFVFPSLSDPWGLVINEAMAAGLPIISTTAPGAVDDLVEDGGNGLLVKSGSEDALLSAMERLAKDPALRLRMGARSTERIVQFKPEVWAEGVRKAVQTVNDRRARAIP